MRSRYEVWYDALVTTQIGDRYGVMLGAHYVDVLKWLPTLRPYPESRHDDSFMDAVYAVTHLVYTLNGYWTYRLDTRLLPQECKYLRTRVKDAIRLRDTDMLGEIMDSLKSFGQDERDPLIRAGTRFLLTHQNRDGSWG